MKEKGDIQTSQLEKDNATLNFVNYQAQEAILNDEIPQYYKDEILKLAIHTIKKVAERRASYHAKFGEGRRTRRPK